MIRRPVPARLSRVTKDEIVLSTGLHIPKGQRVRESNQPGSDGKPRYRVVGAIHFLDTASPYAHDAIHNGIWVEEHQTEEARHA